MIGYILRKIKKYKFARSLKAWSVFIDDSGAIFRNGFQLVMDFPEKGKKYLSIGKDSMLSCRIRFESANGFVTIGERVYLGSSEIICRTSIEFGNDIFVAWGCCFYDHDSHSLDYRERQKDLLQQVRDYRAGLSFITNKNWSPVVSKPIKIGSNAWIGMNATILKGVTIGEGAIVAAGSMVTKDVPAWTVVAGNPAKVVKKLESYIS